MSYVEKRSTQHSPKDGGKLEGDGARVATWSREIHRWRIIGTAILLGFLYQSFMRLARERYAPGQA